jgi:hypothetical protein
MADFGHTFDASQVEPNTEYEVLPPGKYLAQIINSEMRPTKDGTGAFLFLEIDILEGQYQGRKLFDRLNLSNPNPNAVEIAQRTLSSICRAVGRLQVNNSEQLHLLPFIADVRVRPPKGEFGESNSIRYLPRTQGQGTTVQAPVRPAAPMSSPTPASAPPAPGLPWQRRT